MFFAILMGFSLSLLIHSITYGAMETIKIKGARYFSGHISIAVFGGSIPQIHNLDEIIEQLENSDLPIRTVSPRTVYFRQDASLLFGGKSIRQRRLIGIDFQQELIEFSKLRFIEGSIDNLLKNRENKGILISEVAAKVMGARVGDNITLYLTSDTGQFNSETLIIQGIFSETSLFGYVAYMDRKDLNYLLLKNYDAATDIAVYAQKGTDSDKLLLKIRNILSESSAILPPMHSRDDLIRELSEWGNPETSVLAPLTLEAHLQQITSIMSAVKIVTWSIEVLFMFIIMVGILNTYRVLAFERTKEIGTLRAMGMTRREILYMFLIEAFLLDLAATIAGFAVFNGIIKFLGIVDIGHIPGAGLFTESGRLSPHLNLSAICLTSIFMMIAVIVAAWRPARRASLMSPVDAMREEN
jgi:ABC-type lipoprotein release transport system permease subunit